jgi:nucleoside-diphosphate kinase
MSTTNKPKEQTLVLIKPDGVQRSLIGEIIKRYERTGLKLVGLKIVVPEKEQVKKHYLIDPEWKRKVGEKAMASYEKKGLEPPSKDPVEIGESVLSRLQDYLTAGPVIAMVWQGNEAVGIIRKITGATEPMSSDIGTIRGDFTIDSYYLSDTDGRAVRNLIHASGDSEEAEKEIKIWFDPKEIVSYRLVSDAILYDVNLDGIKE